MKSWHWHKWGNWIDDPDGWTGQYRRCSVCNKTKWKWS